MRAVPGETLAEFVMCPAPARVQASDGPYQQQQKALNYLGDRDHPLDSRHRLYNGGVFRSLVGGGRAHSDCREDPSREAARGSLERGRTPGSHSASPRASTTTG